MQVEMRETYTWCLDVGISSHGSGCFANDDFGHIHQRRTKRSGCLVCGFKAVSFSPALITISAPMHLS